MVFWKGVLSMERGVSGKFDSRAGKFLTALQEFCKGFRSPPPYFHVSDPVRNEQERKGVFTGEHFGYIRFGGHPDITWVEEWLSGFEGGARFRFRSDGLGAIAMALQAAGNVRGKRIHRILPLYGGTIGQGEYLRTHPRCDFEFRDYYADDPDLLQKLHEEISWKSGAVLFEVSTNPTVRFADVGGIMRVAKDHPRGRPIVMIDNTFLYGIFFPFHWRADVALASDTKYLVGESAWAAGHCGVSRAFFNECPEFWREANEWANHFGGTPGPMEAWITRNFCLEDLRERIVAHSENAMTVAQFLAQHKCVEEVTYPGLLSYPDRERALRYLEQVSGKQCFGGMIAFSLKADAKATEQFLFHLTRNSLIEYKASLAGPSCMIVSPFFFTHKDLSPKMKERCGITGNLVRLSVGWKDAPEEINASLDYSLCVTIR